MPTGQINRVLHHLRRAIEPRDDAATDGQLLERFLRTRDEVAFEVLVRRHGPMVLGVCKRIAGNHHDAEDAFQATFLVLARKAAAVSPRELLPGWLHGVAWRTARKARTAASRRRAREQPMKETLHPAAPPAEPADDLQAVLDAELAVLPEHQRSAVVLCDVQGRPMRDAARQLGIPVGTLSNRLAAGRRTLARRLARRGLALSTTAIASALGQGKTLASVPSALLTSTVHAAGLTAAGAATAGVVSPAVETLTEGVMKMMLLGKLKTLSAMVLSLVILVVGFGAATMPTLRGSPDEKPMPQQSDNAQKLDARIKALLRSAGESPDVNDETFFRRASLDIRGTIPTLLEMHFFLADRDPKKREKLIDLLLGESNRNVQFSRLMLDASPQWKNVHGFWSSMQQCNSCHTNFNHERSVLAQWMGAIGQNKDAVRAELFLGRRLLSTGPLQEPTKRTDRFDALLDELVAAKRPDAQVLEALTLAVVGRLPTTAEQKHMLDHVSNHKNRREAFENVLFALVHAKEAADHVDALKARRLLAPAEVEWKGQWYPAEVLKKDGERYFIRYLGYDDTWNEWVGKERVRFAKE